VIDPQDMVDVVEEAGPDRQPDDNSGPPTEAAERLTEVHRALLFAELELDCILQSISCSIEGILR
jgi:hypothetical protein